MRRVLLLLTLVGAMLLACTGVVLAQQASPAQEASNHLAVPGQSEDVCPGPVEPGKARCLSKVRTDANTSGVSPNVTPSGYHPDDLQSAYNLPSDTAGSGMIVAIVDAFDDPNAESDLQTYRSQFGLPVCTSANGCFRKVDQRGGTSYPKADEGWALEISLDLDMASAICPNCKILLVEADDSSFANLTAGVDTAASLGANAISNSYGGPELFSEQFAEGSYDHPGIAITAASGDSGYGVSFPAASEFVTAVGGTTLTTDNGTTRGWSESVWGSGGTSSIDGGTGSGCSTFIPKPSWQTDSGCSRRTVGDVAAVADPNTGVAVYDSFGFQGRSGWFQIGGTSASAPIIASVYALAGNTSSVDGANLPYSHTSSLYDVTSGSNGNCATLTTKRKGHRRTVFVPSLQYLCTGVQGYDGPTGNGTPNGTGAF
ncbi:MAG: S53 family peptidase [Actinomycetota bacterium]|nr:S53 family peptidase [Actinomycetota bacterium]